MPAWPPEWRQSIFRPLDHARRRFHLHYQQFQQPRQFHGHSLPVEMDEHAHDDCITQHISQLSLASLQGRLIEYQLRLGYERERQLCRVAGNTVWSHVACEFPYRFGNLANCYTLVTYLHISNKLIHNFTAVTCSEKLAMFREKCTFLWNQ